MKKLYILLFIIASTFTSCTPAKIVKNDYNPKIRYEKVYVTRSQQFMAKGITMIVGFDGKDKIVLENGESKEILVPVGEREFFVRSNQADVRYKINLEVKQFETLCLAGKANTSLTRVILPFMSFFTNIFTIEKTQYCSK